MPQRKYEVSDPTTQDFFQVTDVTDRTGPFDMTGEDGKPIKRYGGITYAVAVFTAYLAKSSQGRIDPQVEANKLCAKLNSTPAPLPSTNRFQVTPGDYNVTDTIAERVIATFRTPWCPNAQAEAVELVGRLNALR
jgi:hypothetical protein